MAVIAGTLAVCCKAKWRYGPILLKNALVETVKAH